MKIVKEPTYFDEFKEDVIYLSDRHDPDAYYRLYAGNIYKYTLGKNDYVLFRKSVPRGGWTFNYFPKDDFITELFSFILMENLL